MSLLTVAIILGSFFSGLIVGVFAVSFLSGAKIVNLYAELGELRHQLSESNKSSLPK